MKKILMVLLIVAFSGGAVAQKKLPKIPGTKRLNDTLQISLHEVSMLEWMLFIVNNDFKPELFPDSSALCHSAALVFDDLRKRKCVYVYAEDNDRKDAGIWDKKMVRENEYMKELTDVDSVYFSLQLPVVGVSFAQAKQYCSWRGAVLSSKYEVIRIRVDLPDIATYQAVAGNIDSVSNRKRADDCAGFVFNYLHEPCRGSKADKVGLFAGKALGPVNFNRSADGELFNIYGNAAEMTSKEGVAFGGSFRHYARECYSDSTQRYAKPENWLGFRCVFKPSRRYPF